ncbi:MAG: DUF4397 domain-containing protein [Niabella sp.]
MRNLNYCWAVIGILLLLPACKKETVKGDLLTSLRIVNVVAGGTTARLNGLTPNIANNPATVNHATAGSAFALLPGTPQIYVWPVGDSLNPYYNANNQVQMQANEYYTLFVGGTPASPQSVLIKESWQNYTDSVVGIRFINMSPNSSPVNVTLSTSTGVNQFENIAFKSYTEFKQFPATSAVASYTFQVRSAANPATVLSSVAISVSGTAAIPRFKNVTIVFRGNVGGSPAPGITRVDHY